MADFKYSAGIDVNLNVKSASSQLKELQNQLKQISNMDFNLSGLNISEEIAEASKAALELQSHLKAATNISTGNLDFTKLNTSLKQSGISLEEYGRKLIALGPEGQKAFMNLSTAISQSEIQMTKSSKLLNTAFENLKKTVGWQISSSIVNSFAGSIQRAVGYAQDLNKSLTNIRIVTGASTDQMAQFAKEANKAAKSLSTTTTDYTKASLIYYQQGLSDAEVKARTETTIKMSNATGTSAQKVSDQMTAIWNNFDNGTKSLTYYADVMTTLGAATASSTDEIAQGLQKFASISDTVGLSYEYAATALATITSTSRESADVVGNSLKTLFSRIQGLQLGKTLDDGTTLNKYSTALAKVGISIKDSSGELKDMDLILDEMGNKWETLARDEQMALAQTVAGVRQYTQLMTLMENWDAFKQNLNIANSSEGTLNKQAEIHAQSWEAASNRIRASFEGLWDNLINDDAVIGIMDFFSSVINGIDGLVSALGGAGGTLAIFGGLFTRIFSDNIAKNVEDIVHDVSQLMPSYRKKQEASKGELIAELGKAQSDFGVNSVRGQVFKDQSEEALTKDVERQKRRERLSDVDKEIYDRRKARVDAAREAERKAAAGIDAAAEKRADAVIDNDDVLNLDENYYSEKENKKREKRRKELEKKTGDRTSDEQTELERIQRKKGQKSEAEKKTLKEIQKKRSKEESEELKQLQRQAVESGISRKKKINETAQQNEDFLRQLSGVTSKQAFDKLADDIYGANAPDIAKALKKNLAEAISDSDSENISKDIVDKVARKTTDKVLKQVADGIEYGPDETPDEEGRKRRQLGAENYAQAQADELRENRNLENATKQKKEATEKLDEKLPSETKMPAGSWAKTLVDGAEGIMEVTAAGQALSGVAKSAADGTATLGSVIGGLAAGGFEAASGLSSLQSALSAIPKLAGIAGPLSLAITAIATFGPVVAELFDIFNTSTEEFQRSIAKSTENLQNVAKETAQAVVTIQQESETHLKTVKQIESYSQDPSTMANDIYEANKQAIDMITKYGQNWIQGEDYTIDQDTGLIKISESSLKEVEEEKSNVANDFERTSNLASTTEQIESGLTNLAEIFNGNEGAAELVVKQYKRSFEGDTEFQQWQNYAKQLESSWGEETFAEIMKNVQQVVSSQNLLDLMSQQNTKSILQEQGLNSQNTQGFKYLNQEMSKLYSKEYQDTLKEYANSADTVGGLWNGLDQIDEDQKSLIKEYLESKGRQGIEKLKYRNGEIKYYSDDTEGEQSIEWEDVKRWKAESEAESTVLDNYKTELNGIQDLYNQIGESAEAVLNFENFGNLNQISVESLTAAYNDLWDAENGVWKTGQQVDEINEQLGDSFDKFKQQVVETYKPVETFESLFQELGDTITGVDRDTLNMEGLQNLDRNIKDFVGEDALKEVQEYFSGEDKTGDNKVNTFKEMSPEAQNLVKYTEGIEQMLQSSGLDAEGMAQAFNQIAQLDWTDDAGTNLRNIVSTIGNLGGDIDIANWDSLRGIMQDLSGTMPDYSGTIAQLTQIQQILNSLKTGDSITAEINVLLKMMGINTISDGKGGFIVTASQEEIDDAVSSNQGEINDKVTAQRQAHSAYQNYKTTVGNNARTTTFNSYQDLEKYMSENEGASAFNDFIEDATGSNLNGDIGEVTSSEFSPWQWLMKWLGGKDSNDELAEADQIRAEEEQRILDYANSAIEAGQEGVPTEDIQSLAATYEDAAGLMEAINSKDSAFRDENGLVDSGTLEYLQTLPKTSERATAAVDAFAEAEANLQELKDSGANEDEISRAQAISDEAAAYAELQTTIDAVATARGLDADVLAQQTTALQQTGEYSDATTDSLIAVAAEIIEHKQAINELSKGYRDLSSKIRSGKKDSTEWAQTMAKMKKLLAGVLNIKDWNQLSDAFILAAESSGLLAKAAKGDKDAIADLAEYSLLAGEAIENGLVTETDLAAKGFAALDAKVAELANKTDLTGPEQAFLDFANNVNTVLDGIKALDVGEIIPDGELHNAVGSALQAMDGFSGGLEGLAKAASRFELTPILEAVDVNNEAAVVALEGQQVATQTGENSFEVTSNFNPANFSASSGATLYKIRYAKTGGDGSVPSGGGGGGGGGPKKVANKRKSQTVKRHKKPDFKRERAQSFKKSAEKSKDYLYGESKIAQMEKINKLAEKEAHITSDRIKESQKYLKEDRENLIKVMQKWGYDATFDEDGFLTSYEEAWTKIHEKIAKLYEDNELTADEQKLEEDYKVKLEELEGALEDYENSLKELQADIEAYEESLYEMYDNKIDAIQHKVEFKIELNEDDIGYIDFLLEALGDTASYSVNRIELINQKMDALFNNISTIKEGIAEIYDISNDELQVFATGGLDIEGLLTEAQVEKLRELRDQLMEEMQSLIEEYQKAMEEPLTVFDSWTEKIDHSIATVEHYSSILSQLRNVIDITGRDIYGFTDTFMRNLENITISQSLDTIAANREYYESLIAQQAEAEAGLMQAREQGDEATIAKWEEIVRTTTEAAQSTREALVSGLENTLTLISDQFTAALEDAVKNFNDALYASGGLEGLSNDYSLMREHADLMAADYDKIYNLSKLTRNINKSLDDTKIIAGKQKLNSLLEEINALQATGVELSKYDLEYLEAKYNLYLAQIELENARNAKDTVTLSRDSEGNWAYVYTSNEEKIAETEQKYEDTLYEMQNKNHEYMEEMSGNMIAMTQQMQEEMAGLNPADFAANPEEYIQALQEIQDKYDKLLKTQNDELNKTIENNTSLYETDWKNYSKYTGYKISNDEKWINSFKETTLGHLVGSDSIDSDFQNTVYKLTTELSKGLSEAAINYFKNIDEALKTYGTSIDEFGSNIINTITSIKNTKAGESIEDMASKMSTAFKDAADALKAFQETRLSEITTELGEISTIISQINKDIRDSANIINDKDTSLIGDSKAVDLLNESGLFGTWTYNKRGDMNIIDENGNKTEGTNFQAYNAKLIEELDKARSDYQEGKITKEDLDEMYERYWMFKDIINRIYNSDNLVDPPAAFDTGGYTGEWGNAGKLAMLHQKELILNPDDTENFLEAIKLTKDMMSVLDFQIQYAKLGMGVLEAYDLQHQPSETVIEQQVTIQAEFPNVSDHNEVEEAIYNLINTASQYANRQ